MCEQIKHCYRRLVFLGDVNIDLLSESDLKQNLIDAMKSYNFSINSKIEPTRETATTSSCMYFIASNLEVTKSNILKTSISDHYALQILVPNANKKPEHHCAYRNLKVFDNQETRLNFLFSLNHWLQKNDMNSTCDSKMQQLDDYFVKTVDKYAPLTKCVCKHSKKMHGLTTR